MRVLLDTQLIILAYLSGELPKRIRSLLERPDTERLVSTASLVEIAIKSQKGKVAMTASDFSNALEDLVIEVIPFTHQHAMRMYSLPAHHHDPFDRMLISTALAESIPLVGGDRQFTSYKGLEIVW